MGWRHAALWTALLAVPTGSALADPGEFTIHEVTSAQQPIKRLKQAYQLLNGQIAASDSEDSSSPFIHFATPGDFHSLRFPDTVPFPTGTPEADHSVAVGITGQVEIPTAGNYSFGLTGNVPARLVINGKAVRIGLAGGLSTHLKPIEFDHAGEYSLSITYIERPGRSALELYSAPGKFHSVHARNADFQLVGDFANGGLSLAQTTPVTSDPSTGSEPPVVGGGNTGTPSPIVVGSGTTISAGTATTSGLLSTDSENWQGGGTYLWKINDLAGTAGNADGWDELSMPALTVSSVSAGAPFTIKLQSFNASGAGTPRGLGVGASGGVNTWTIAHSDTPISLPDTPQNLLASGQFALNTDGFTVDGASASPSDFQLQLVDVGSGQDLQLVYNANPEPTATLLIAVGVVPVLARRRRRVA